MQMMKAHYYFYQHDSLLRAAFRSRLAPLYVDEPHHRCQLQEAPGVRRKGEFCEQQVWALPAAQRGEWVRYFYSPLSLSENIYRCTNLLFFFVM